MRMVGKSLSTLGGKGPILLVISLAAGVLSHPLAHFGYGLLPVSAFLLTLGSFLTAGLAPTEIKTRTSLIAVVLAWVGVALPLAGAALLWFVPLDPALRAGVLLSLLAPPVGSAAAIAAMLGLQPRLALLVSIALTLLAPISIPCFATLLGLGIAFDMATLATRLFAIIGVAALVAYLALRFRQRLMPILPDQRAATGVAAIGLVIVGLATSQGIQAQWHTSPSTASRRCWPPQSPSTSDYACLPRWCFQVSGCRSPAPSASSAAIATSRWLGLRQASGCRRGRRLCRSLRRAGAGASPYREARHRAAFSRSPFHSANFCADAR